MASFFNCKCKPTKEFWEHLIDWVSKIPQILQQQERINTTMSQLTDEIAALRTEVAEDTTVIESAVTLINGFAANLASAIAAAIEAGATPESLATLNELKATLTTEKTRLAEAVAANIPPVPPIP